MDHISGPSSLASYHIVVKQLFWRANNRISRLRASPDTALMCLSWEISIPFIKMIWIWLKKSSVILKILQLTNSILIFLHT